jgi:hypothetical protein
VAELPRNFGNLVAPGFNMAFVVGFGAAKLPAMRLQTSAFFFQLLDLTWVLRGMGFH